MANFIHGRAVIDALLEHGIADEQTRRVVIDIPVDGIPIIYTEKFGDERLLEIVKPVGDLGVVVSEGGKNDG